MADHGHVEAGSAPEMHTRRRRSRLMHDANLRAKLRGHAPPHELLQRDKPIRACKRAQSRRWVAIDIIVDVGAAQSHDQRPIGVKLAKVPDAVRAAPCVDCNHQVCGRSIISVGSANAMAKLAQDPRPPRTGGLVSGP